MHNETREPGVLLPVCASRGVRAIAVMCVAALTSTGAFAGPDWDKDLSEDAGSSPATAQIITINSPILRITGQLMGLALQGEGDFQDVYLFSISEPTNFKIDLTASGSGASFDSCLWLFSIDGKPLLGNNDAAPGVLGSLLTNQSNDGPSFTITVPGLYYLAITGFNSQPLDATGKPLFPESVFTAGNITGGLGGRFDGGWSESGIAGTYAIETTGVSGVPAPGVVALLAMAGLLGNTCGGRRRSRFSRDRS